LDLTVRAIIGSLKISNSLPESRNQSNQRQNREKMGLDKAVELDFAFCCNKTPIPRVDAIG